MSGTDIFQKINGILPELKHQIQLEVRKQLALEFSTKIQRTTQQLKNQYTQKMQDQIANFNQSIKQQLQQMNQQCQTLRDQSKHLKKRSLTKQEEEDIVEQTVAQIIDDQAMLDELRLNRLAKVDERVQMILHNDIESACQNARQELAIKNQNQRVEWEAARREAWNEEGQLELNELAQEYEALDRKKAVLHESLMAKKREREEAKKKYEERLMENDEIAILKAQIKELEKK